MVNRFHSIAKFLPMLLAGTILIAGQLAIPTASAQEASMKIALHWRQLPPIPDHEGFAAPFAGTSGGALVMAGGSNFPDKRLWDGGVKTWYDTIYLLEPGAKAWQIVGRLPHLNAYGISASTPSGMVCAGGGDAKLHFRERLSTRVEGGENRQERLAEPAAALFFRNRRAGGQHFLHRRRHRAPQGHKLSAHVLGLGPCRGIAALAGVAALSGGERMLAVAGAAEGSFFLFSGVELKAGPDGKPVASTCATPGRVHARDRGWKRLADLPRFAAAAPSPAPLVADSHLLVISGDDATERGLQAGDGASWFPRTTFWPTT